MSCRSFMRVNRRRMHGRPMCARAASYWKNWRPKPTTSMRTRTKTLSASRPNSSSNAWPRRRRPRRAPDPNACSAAPVRGSTRCYSAARAGACSANSGITSRARAAHALASASAAARAATVHQHVADPDLLQRFQPASDLIRIAIDRVVHVDRMRIAGGAVGATMHRSVRACCKFKLPHAVLQPSVQRRVAFRLAVCDEEGAGDADLHRIVAATRHLGRRPEPGDALRHIAGRGVLTEQKIEATFGNVADRALAAGAHPNLRMRLLRRRRLDDDVVEPPVFAVMREALFGRPRLQQYRDGLLESRVGFLHRHVEP